MNSPRALASSPQSASTFDAVLSGERELFPLVVLGLGFAARLFEAWRYFLNPDEALHNLLASQDSLRLAYKAALTNAHPPLLILLIHYWRWLGQSELMLRMPSVIAGTACCWLTYLWLREIVDRSTAFVGLTVLALAPAMISLSAEIRQYALLLLFTAACLYCSERALRRNSALWMVLFSLSLYGALLVHYSSFIFAIVMGVYMLVRLYPYRDRLCLSGSWAAGQAGGVALAAYYFFNHIVPLQKTGMLSGGYDTWLRKSIYQPGENNGLLFAGKQTLRVFTFLFSHGFVGTLALLTFLTGLVLLLLNKDGLNKQGPSARQLALLLGLPFLVNCAAALARQYPYGGTRHSAFLAVFAASGTAIGLSFWKSGRVWIKPLVIGLVLVFCNFFPAPPRPIRPRNQTRVVMEDAVRSLRQAAPPGATILAAYQSGLLLGYYGCGHGIVQVFPPFRQFAEADCGDYRVITTIPSEWKFYAKDFPDDLSAITKSYKLTTGSKVWLFDAGWISDSAPALIHDPGVGCASVHTFGEDIFFCELTVGERDASKVQDGTKVTARSKQAK